MRFVRRPLVAAAVYSSLYCSLFASLTAGCSLNAMTGDMMSAYTVEEMTPYLLESDDLGMACETGVSMGAYLMSFERVTDPPDKAAISTLVTAASCAQVEVWEAELASLRAIKAGVGADAQDARIRERRAHGVAAKRFYRAWRRVGAAYGAPGGACPELEEESDELTWLMGMLAGAQGIQHDRASGGMAGMPLDVPRKAARGILCLNNAKWWGVPRALSAAIWTSIPGAAPEGVDPWKVMAEATAVGISSGMRLAQVIEAQAIAAAGRTQQVRAAIVAHAKAIEARPAAGRFRLLDLNATLQVQVLSDRMWTEATGHRTPIGALGTFWDDEAGEVDDGLLEGLGGDEAPDQAAPTDGGDSAAQPQTSEEKQ